MERQYTIETFKLLFFLTTVFFYTFKLFYNLMLKIVLSAIPSFAMTCFIFFIGLCKMIQSAVARFWWDSNTDKKNVFVVLE